MHQLGLQELRQGDVAAAGDRVECVCLDQPAQLERGHRDAHRAVEGRGVDQVPVHETAQRDLGHPQQVVQDRILIKGGLRVDGAQLEQAYKVHVAQVLQVTQVEVVEDGAEVHRQAQRALGGVEEDAEALRQDIGLGELLDEVLDRVDLIEVDPRHNLIGEGGREVQHVAQRLVHKRDLSVHEVVVDELLQPVQRALNHRHQAADIEVAEVDQRFQVGMRERQVGAAGGGEERAAESHAWDGVDASDRHPAQRGVDREIDVYIVVVCAARVRGQAKINAVQLVVRQRSSEIQLDVRLLTVWRADTCRERTKGSPEDQVIGERVALEGQFVEREAHVARVPVKDQRHFDVDVEADHEDSVAGDLQANAFGFLTHGQSDLAFQGETGREVDGNLLGVGLVP